MSPLLPRTFGNAQGQRLLNVCQRVAPAEQVANIRANILLAKLRKFHETPGGGVAIGGREQPDEIQTLVRVRDVRNELKETQQRTAEKRERLDALREKTSELSTFQNVCTKSSITHKMSLRSNACSCQCPA